MASCFIKAVPEVWFSTSSGAYKSMLDSIMMGLSATGSNFGGDGSDVSRGHSSLMPGVMPGTW
ncbi:hypothetical protein BVX99_03095 [bacterium F16]|nr:hypothetical protein BVX99_03095 [bacterium F16]